jgi:hypothetical protein
VVIADALHLHLVVVCAWHIFKADISHLWK